MSSLFVTGMQRSGTTLLEKLLHTPPEVATLSQPFPLLFVEAKRVFLERLGGAPDRYPLGDLFRETRYRPRDLREFLDGWRPTADAIRDVFAAMKGYSGRYTDIAVERVEDLLPRIERDGFAALVASLYRELAGGAEATCTGGKEVLCEEFAPAMLGGGFRVALIVRDPRDVLASLNHGRGRDHAGRLKPTLFNVRNWRKSVAFALALEGTPGFRWLRYEDLVREPGTELLNLRRALKLPQPATPTSTEALADQAGKPWSGNSSFAERRGVDAQSVGSHRAVLPEGAAELVEAACWPELGVLGYPRELDLAQARERLCDFRDPYPLERPELDRYVGAEAIRDEVERLDLLSAQETAETQPFFVLPGVQRRLTESSSNPTP